MGIFKTFFGDLKNAGKELERSVNSVQSGNKGWKYKIEWVYGNEVEHRNFVNDFKKWKKEYVLSWMRGSIQKMLDSETYVGSRKQKLDGILIWIKDKKGNWRIVQSYRRKKAKIKF